MKLTVRLILAIASLAALGSGSVRAAELTLDDCIDLALKNRAAIIAARGAEQLSKATERAALGAFLPNISAAYDYTKVDQRTKSSQLGDSTIHEKFTNKQTTLGGSINFTLPDVWFSYIASRADHESSRLDVIASEQDMILAVKTAYYSYLAAAQNVSVADETVKRSEEQLKLIQSKYDLGSAALSDVLKQKVQYGNDRLTQLQAENSVATAKAMLAYTIGIDPRQDTEFSTTYVPRTYEGTMDDAINFGLSHRPTLLSQEKTLTSAKYRLNSAYSGYLPKVAPFVSYNYSKATGLNPAFYTTRTTTQNTFSYGFGLSLNIFDGFLREQRVSQAKVTRNNAMAQLADLRNQVASDIKTNYLNIGAYKEQKSVTDETVASAKEDLKITQEKYNLGAATILDLLNAQVSLKQAEQSQIQADFDLNLAVSKLENAMGKM